MNRTYVVRQLRTWSIFSSFLEPGYWNHPTFYHLRFDKARNTFEMATCRPTKCWSDWEDIDWKQALRIIRNGYLR